MLYEEREPCLDAFAGIAAALPQKSIFRRLLADRRPTPDAPTGGVTFHCIFNCLHVEPVMRAELSVFGRNRRSDHVAIDRADWHPLARCTSAGENVPQHRR